MSQGAAGGLLMLTGVAMLTWQLGVNWFLRDILSMTEGIFARTGQWTRHTNWKVVGIAVAMIFGGAMFANL